MVVDTNIVPPAARHSRDDFGGWHPAASKQIDSHTIRVMWFSTSESSFGRQEKLTLPDLCDEIGLTTLPEDAKPPSFCLYDNQEFEVSGINAQHKWLLSKPGWFDDACKRIRKANIRALLYNGPGYPVPSTHLLSNSKHFVPVSSTARRFFIPTVSPDHMQDFAYFAAIEDQLRNEGGYEALLYHFLSEVDLKDFKVRDVPKTAGLTEQAALGRRGVDGLVEEVCSYGRVPCEHWKWPGYTITSLKEQGLGFFVYIDNHRDKELAPYGAHRVIKQLVKQWGCRAVGQQRDSGNSAALRISGLQWPALEQLRTKFEERFGKQEWLHPEVTEWTISGKPPTMF